MKTMKSSYTVLTSLCEAPALSPYLQALHLLVSLCWRLEGMGRL